MKRILFIISGLALGLGMGSCANEIASDISAPETPDASFTFIVGGQLPGSDSRAALDDMLSFYWTAGDSIIFYYDVNTAANSGGGANINAAAQTTQVTICELTSGANSNRALFENRKKDTFVMDGPVSPTRRFYAAYPAHTNAQSPGQDSFSGVYEGSLSNANGYCALDIQRTQTQDGVSDPQGLGKYLLMWADPIDDAEGLLENGFFFQFRHLCSVLGFNIMNLPDGVAVKSVRIEAYDPVTLDPTPDKTLDVSPFIARVNLVRSVSKGGLFAYGAVTNNNYSTSGMTVQMKEPVGGVDFTAKMAILGTDFQSSDGATVDQPGTTFVNGGSGPDAARFLRVIVAVEKDGVDDTYTFYKLNANGEHITTKTYWKPGFYYYRDLDFEGKVPDSELVAEPDPDPDPIEP